MKKSMKMIIGGIVLIIIVTVIIGIVVCNKTSSLETKSNEDVNNKQVDKQIVRQRVVKVDGKLYYDTGKESKDLRCGNMDGKIISNVDNNELPTLDNQSNFKGEYGYQYGVANTIEINIDNKWCIFENTFEIYFYDKQSEDSTKISKILERFETDKYDYNIYACNGIVNIFIQNEEIPLRKALLENKITIEEIIAKADKDLEEGKIIGEMYKDGGSMRYQYENYTIIKCNTLDGNKDVYIGMNGITINDL